MSIPDTLLVDFDPHSHQSDLQMNDALAITVIRDSSNCTFYDVYQTPEYSGVKLNGYNFIYTRHGGFRNPLFGDREKLFGLGPAGGWDPLMYAAQYGIFQVTFNTRYNFNATVITHGTSSAEC